MQCVHARRINTTSNSCRQVPSTIDVSASQAAAATLIKVPLQMQFKIVPIACFCLRHFRTQPVVPEGRRRPRMSLSLKRPLQAAAKSTWAALDDASCEPMLRSMLWAIDCDHPALMSLSSLQGRRVAPTTGSAKAKARTTAKVKTFHEAKVKEARCRAVQAASSHVPFLSECTVSKPWPSCRATGRGHRRRGR